MLAGVYVFAADDHHSSFSARQRPGDVLAHYRRRMIGVRLQRFIEVYPEAVAKRAVPPTVVDLRYPNGFAMRVAGEGKGK